MIQFPRFYLKNENGQILFDVDTNLSAVIYETVNVMKMIFSGLLNIAANIMIHAVIPLSDIYGYITATIQSCQLGSRNINGKCTSFNQSYTHHRTEHIIKHIA